MCREMEDVWNKIEIIRKDRGLSVKEIAYRANMTRQNYHSLKNYGNTSTRTLIKIAKALGVPLAALFGV